MSAFTELRLRNGKLLMPKNGKSELGNDVWCRLLQVRPTEINFYEYYVRRMPDIQIMDGPIETWVEVNDRRLTLQAWCDEAFRELEDSTSSLRSTLIRAWKKNENPIHWR